MAGYYDGERLALFLKQPNQLPAFAAVEHGGGCADEGYGQAVLGITLRRALHEHRRQILFAPEMLNQIRVGRVLRNRVGGRQVKR